MNYLIIGIIVFDLLLFGGIGLLILKNEKIYIKEEGRWIPGFNLPRLYTEKGDEVDHDGFRRHVGLSIIRFGVYFTIYMVGFIFIMEKELFSETYMIGIALLASFGLVLFLVYDMFTRTEKYVIRHVSRRIGYEKYLYRMLILISVINVLPVFFEKNLFELVIVAIFLTVFIAAYYIYRIYLLLKENKKDFL